MATLKEYYDTDFTHALNKSGTFRFVHDDATFVITGRLHFDFDANATFISIYLPDLTPAVPLITAILQDVQPILALAQPGETEMGLPGERLRSIDTMRFAGRIFIYHEQDITSTIQDLLLAEAAARDLFLQLRGPTFASERTRIEKPLAFVSHDSRDKDAIARPIAIGLARMMCPVWFDEFSLRVGDRLRESIELGLREAKKCILILTPNFLNNAGWTKTEFNSVFTRELIQQSDVILPVWHSVSPSDVYDYSPSLADRVAAHWSSGEQQVVRSLYRAIQ